MLTYTTFFKIKIRLNVEIKIILIKIAYCTDITEESTMSTHNAYSQIKMPFKDIFTFLEGVENDWPIIIAT